jgi:hypothetical protein
MLRAGIEFHRIWWVMTGMCGAAALLVILGYRDPQKEEGSEVSTQALSFREIWPVMKQHQLLMVFIAWMAFWTAVSFGLSWLTLLQFGIQFFTAPVFGGIQDAAVAAGASSAAAWATAANFSIIPLGIVALICTFFIRQKPPVSALPVKD